MIECDISLSVVFIIFTSPLSLSMTRPSAYSSLSRLGLKKVVFISSIKMLVEMSKPFSVDIAIKKDMLLLRHSQTLNSVLPLYHGHIKATSNHKICIPNKGMPFGIPLFGMQFHCQLTLLFKVIRFIRIKDTIQYFFSLGFRNRTQASNS